MDGASTKVTTGAADLVSRIVAGDRVAEDELVHRYSRGMLAVINNIVYNHIDAEELVQEMFIIALKKIRRGDLREPDRLSGFMRGIAKNLALDHARRAEGRAFTNIDEVPPPSDPHRGPLEQLLQKEEAGIVRQVLAELKEERDRQIIIRYYLLEEDKDAICANLGVTRVHFHRVKFRALGRFKELYEEARSSKKLRDRRPDER